MIDPTCYKQVMGSFPSGVTVVTTLDAAGNLAGLTASAFSAVSLDPALVLFCPQYDSATYPVLRERGRFAIHLLSAEQQPLAYAFASKGRDKTAGIDWQLSALGNPLLDGATAIIECRLWREYEGGDHAILVCEVENLVLPEQDATPMIYCRGRMGALPLPA